MRATWWALLLTVGFAGLLRVAEALGIGSTPSRIVAAVAFALSPRVLTTLGSISSETWPMMLAPWVLLPTILALRGSPAGSDRSVRALAARGKAVLYISHVLELVEKICDHIIVIFKGRIVADDSVARLRELMQLPSLEQIFAQLVQQEDMESRARDIAELISR